MTVLAMCFVMTSMASGDTGRWLEETPLPDARTEVAVTAFGDRIYVQ